VCRMRARENKVGEVQSSVDSGRTCRKRRIEEKAEVEAEEEQLKTRGNEQMHVIRKIAEEPAGKPRAGPRWSYRLKRIV
jgi:hypothetical protein